MLSLSLLEAATVDASRFVPEAEADDAGTADTAGGTPTTLPATLPETLPATLLAALLARLRGVSGGVAAAPPLAALPLPPDTAGALMLARPAMMLLLLGEAAARLGTVPTTRGGLLMTDPGPPAPVFVVEAAGSGTTDPGCVTTDDVELERAGDDGRLLTKEAVGGGEGAEKELAELRCW